jgi:hypothetical protein
MRRTIFAVLVALHVAACGGGGSKAGVAATLSPRERLKAQLIAAAPANFSTLLVDVNGRGAGTFGVTSTPPASLAPALDTDVGLWWVYVPQGASVTITPAPDGTSVFASWGGQCTGQQACTLVATSVQEVEAVFERGVLTVTVDGLGQGSVTSDHDTRICSVGRCPFQQPGSAGSVTLTAAAAANSRFAGWWGDCDRSTATAAGGTCTVATNRERSVRASFQANRIPIVLRSCGDGTGNVSASGTIEGTLSVGGMLRQYAFHVDSTLLPRHVVLHADPAPDTEFHSWGGACSGTADCALDVSQPAEVSVVFRYLKAAFTVQLPDFPGLAHSFTVTINPADNTFSGTGTVTPGGTPETVTGRLDEYGNVAEWVGSYADGSGYVWSYPAAQPGYAVDNLPTPRSLKVATVWRSLAAPPVLGSGAQLRIQLVNYDYVHSFDITVNPDGTTFTGTGSYVGNLGTDRGSETVFGGLDAYDVTVQWWHAAYVGSTFEWWYQDPARAPTTPGPCGAALCAFDTLGRSLGFTMSTAMP